MKVIARQNRDLVLINAQNTQNENDAEKITLQVPEQYEDFNKKIVFVTPDGNVWDIITNNEYLIKKAITKYKQVDFYIWLTKGDVDFRSQTKTLKFYQNVDASDEITDEEIGRVNTVVNLLEEEITKVENLESQIDGKLEEVDTAIDNIHTAIQETENLDLDAEKVGQTTTITLTKKDGTVKTIHIDDGIQGEKGERGEKGEKGDTGEKGEKGEKGDTYDDSEIKNDISAINTNIKANYYNKADTDTKLDTKANTTDISKIKEEQTTQNENISKNADEITNARSSSIKNKTFASVDARIEELEADVDNIETTRGHVYGIRRKITSNSSSAWERLFDSIGKTATATKNGGIVQNDFDSLAPWSDIKSCNYDLTTKKINAWFGDANFKFDGTNGDVFTHIPKTYWKIYQEDDYDYVLLADYPRAGFMEVDGFFVGRYNGSVVSDVLHSYSGLVPTINKTRAQFRTLANALGNNFSQLDWRYLVLQMLYLVEYASYDSQSKLSNGIMNHTTVQKTGQCDSLGMKSGCLNNDGHHSVIYRGVENLFAHIWQFVDGINIKDRVAYICKDHSQYADNVFADAYKALAYTNASNDGWAKTLGLDVDEPFFRFPTETGGDSSDYMADYYFQSAGNMVARVGGNFNSGAYDGLWYWAFNSDSSVAGLIGCRVLIDNQ